MSALSLFGALDLTPPYQFSAKSACLAITDAFCHRAGVRDMASAYNGGINRARIAWGKLAGCPAKDTTAITRQIRPGCEGIRRF